MVVSISLLRKHIPVLDGPIESKLISGRKKPYESLDKCGNAAAAKEKSVAEEPVKEKKDRVYSVIITIITNAKLYHLTKISTFYSPRTKKFYVVKQ